MKLLSFFGPPLYSLEVRPEKDHAAQIRMMSWLRMRYPEHRQSMRLLLVGGVRNEGDSARVKELKELADSLQVSVSGRPSRRSLIYGAIGQTIQEYVDFVVNAPYPRILELLGEASIGVNTMVDEHFGINVVEFMVSPIFFFAIDKQRTRGWLMGLLWPSI